MLTASGPVQAGPGRMWACLRRWCPPAGIWPLSPAYPPPDWKFLSDFRCSPPQPPHFWWRRPPPRCSWDGNRRPAADNWSSLLCCLLPSPGGGWNYFWKFIHIRQVRRICFIDNDHRKAKTIRCSVVFAAKLWVWQQMLKEHLRDAHCNDNMAKQPCCFAKSHSGLAQRLQRFAII